MRATAKTVDHLQLYGRLPDGSSPLNASIVVWRGRAYRIFGGSYNPTTGTASLNLFDIADPDKFITRLDHVEVPPCASTT